MKKILIFLGCVLFSAQAFGQAVMEATESASVMNMNEPVKEFTHADTTMFAVVGTGKLIRTGVMNLWKYTTFQGKAAGDSVNVKVRYWTGWCDRVAGSSRADTTKMHFAVVDSQTVTAAGEFRRQVSDATEAAPWFYAEMIPQTGNGTATVIGPCKAIRDRY